LCLTTKDKLTVVFKEKGKKKAEKEERKARLRVSKESGALDWMV
jgi:hypothetical protein